MMDDFFVPRFRTGLCAAPLLLTATLLTACRTDPAASFSPDQTRELKIFVAAYHYCVAHTAARIDDGRTPVGDVAAAAMIHCEPEARDVVGFLGSIPAPDDYTQRYLRKLLTSAARNSASMLLRQRFPAPATHAV